MHDFFKSTFVIAIVALQFLVTPAAADVGWSDECVSGSHDIADEVQTYKRYTGSREHGPNSLYANTSVSPDQSAELHVVGSNEGSGRVTVRRSDKPIELLLSAYDAGEWVITLEPGAKLQRVILQGYKLQRVTGLPDRVEIVARGRCKSAYSWEPENPFVGKRNARFDKFIRSVQEFTGLVESSFQGSYGVGKSFVVPPKFDSVTASPLKFTDPSVKETRDKTLARYRAYRDGLDKGPAETMSVLIEAMARQRLPVHFASDAHPSKVREGGARFFEALTLPRITAPVVGSPHTCSDRNPEIVKGYNGNDTINCAHGDQIYATGAGRDVINDSWGDDIIDAGAGNDIIDAGWGRDIIVFRKNWGQDVVSKTCHHAVVPDPTKMFGGDRNADWRWKYMNFIVFGPDIHPKDMMWTSKNVLEHVPSGATVTLNDKCFNIAFVEEGEIEGAKQTAGAKPKNNRTPKPSSKNIIQRWSKRFEQAQSHWAAIRKICKTKVDSEICSHLRGIGLIN